MDLAITCCIILHNMIVNDEWEEHKDAAKNNAYVFQEANGERFKVDGLYKDESTELFGSVNIREMQRRYQDNATRHHELKNDLVEHLWNVNAPLLLAQGANFKPVHVVLAAVKVA